MKAKIEQKRLKDLGIIEEVPDDQTITWCTNPVIAPKPRNPDMRSGIVQICEFLTQQ